MKWKLNLASVTAAAIVIAAVAIASPALGGSSGSAAVSQKKLKKLVRTEVTRQIAKAKGPAGAIGASGANGSNGFNGATSVVVRKSAPVAVTSGTSEQEFAQCLGSEKAVGGGASWQEVTDHNMRLLESGPAGPAGTAPTEWEVIASNDTGSTTHLVVKVVCASP